MDLPFNLRPLAGRVQRPQPDTFFGAGANRQFVHLGYQLICEFVDHRIKNKDALNGQTGLPAIEEAPHRGRAHGFVDIGIITDNDRIGTAQFQRDPLDGFSRAGHDLPADLGRAGKPNFSDVGMLK